MAQHPSNEEAVIRAEQSPTAWFAMLERARERNDYEAAAMALAKLRELGVQVRFLSAAKREAAHA